MELETCRHPCPPATGNAAVRTCCEAGLPARACKLARAVSARSKMALRSTGSSRVALSVAMVAPSLNQREL